MKTGRKFLTLFATGALPFVTWPALAQSGTPVAEPPPAVPTPEVAVSVEKTHSAPVSHADAPTNSVNKTSDSGTVGELRFAGVDADSNGLISLTEFSIFMDAGSAPRSAGETGVSPTELLFRTIDRNSDNFLSETELAAYQDEQNRTNR